MSSHNYQTLTKYYENLAGLVFEKSGKKFHKTDATGFVGTEKTENSSNFGLVTWTDHDKELISWLGSHRYYKPDGGAAVIYRNRRAYNLPYPPFGGVVAGAAYKNGVFIVFESSQPYLYAHFVKTDLTFLATVVAGSTGGYGYLVQHVCVSPDGSKAVFMASDDLIAVENNLHLVELAIDWVNLTVTEISNNNTEIHRFDGAEKYPNDSTQSFSFDGTIAADYLPDNTLKTLAMNTVLDYEKSYTETLETYDYTSYTYENSPPDPPTPHTVTILTRTVNDACVETETVTYSGIDLTLESSFSRARHDESREDPLFPGATPPNMISTAEDLANSWQTSEPDIRQYVLWIDLDLRFELYAYQKITETVNTGWGRRFLHQAYKASDVTTEFWLKIGTYHDKFLVDKVTSKADVSELTADEFQPYNLSNTFNAWLPPLGIFRNYDKRWDPYNGDNITGAAGDGLFQAGAYGNGIYTKNATDKYGNKLLQYAPLWRSEVYNVSHPETQFIEKYDPPVVFKVQNDNTFLSAAGISDIYGAI